MVHWTQKYEQGLGLHENYPINCYNKCYEIITTSTNSNSFTDFDLKN